MNSWDKKSIRLLKCITLFSLCFYVVNIHAEGKTSTPTKEANSLNNTKLNFVIPIIDASNSSASFSSFESLLDSKTIPLPNKNQKLPSKVGKQKNQPLIHSIDYAHSIKNLSSKLERVHPSKEIESTKKKYSEEKFLNDIVSDLKKTKNHQNIKTIFYPENKPTATYELEEQLKHSLEFKVLAPSNKSTFTTTVPDENVSLKHLHPPSANITTNPITLSPHKNDPFQVKSSLTSEELFKQKQYTSTSLQEDHQKLDQKSFTIAKIYSDINSVYSYSPIFSFNTLQLEKIQSKDLKKDSVKPSLATFPLTTFDEAIVFNPMFIELKDEKALPTPVLSSYMLPISVTKIEEKKQLINKYHFNADRENTVTSLSTSKTELIQKNSYSKPQAKPINSNELTSIDPPQFDKNIQGVNSNIPSNEVLLTSDTIKHEFTTSSHLSTPIVKTVALYPLEKGQSISLSDSKLGHLRENVHLGFYKDLPDYSKEEKLAQVAFRSFNYWVNPRKDQKAVSISFKLPYDQLYSSQIKSSITPNVEHVLHPFTVRVSPIGFSAQMEKIDSAIIKDKIIVPIETPIDFSNGKELSLVTDNLTASFPLETIVPYSWINISLQTQLPISNAKFDGEISLPNFVTIDNERSFFLNPMLSLIDSTPFNDDYAIFSNASLVNRSNRMTQYWLFNLPSLDELDTDSFPDAFNLETKLLSTESETNNDFFCTINNCEKNILDPIPVHILYILDTSSTIEPHRFAIFKEAIVNSLDQLDKDSTFNIAVLSKDKVEMLHDQNPHPTTSSKGYVKRFLKKIKQTNKTSFKDLISLLEKEKNLASKTIHHRSCLLLSDGKFANNIRVDRKLLQSLTKIEAGNFSIYTASISDNNNKGMLSLLAKLNHGFSLYTPTHSSFSRKFSILLKHIKHPLMHDVMISFPDDDDAIAYLSNAVSPLLLADKAFSFYGKSKSNKPSRVFIQGRSKDRWINIVKEVPLHTARKGRDTLKKKLASQKSVLSLQSFLETKDENYLLQANEFGKEFDLSLPIP